MEYVSLKYLFGIINFCMLFYIRTTREPARKPTSKRWLFTKTTRNKRDNGVSRSQWMFFYPLTLAL